jgi:hypothetical protein
MRQEIFSILSLVAMVIVLQQPLSAQRLQIGKEPGVEVPEVTAGPGWKTCVNCQNAGHVKAARGKYKVDGHAFNPRDISGMWTNAADTPTGGYGGTFLDFKDVPPMTPYGKQLWEATQAVQTRPEIPPMNGGEGSKDPMLHCDPLGYPRSFTYHYGYELITLPDRVLQFFEWGGYHRTIWTDGRKVPDDPPQPRWYGYNVGHWEGDTFIVESTGFDDRSWLDQDRRNMQRGMPHSDQMKLVERYKRTAYDTMELELTIIDPKVYTTPWVIHSKQELRPGTEISEYYCVPSDSEQYNRELTEGKHDDSASKN